jgi:hypothetical protein
MTPFPAQVTREYGGSGASDRQWMYVAYHGMRRFAKALAGFFREQVVQIAAFLMGPDKSNRHFAAGANLALQAFADFP